MKNTLDNTVLQALNNTGREMEKRLRYAKWHKKWTYGVMNPPQRADFNIIEAVWDHFDGEWNKRQKTSKEELWDVLRDAWRTIPEDYLKEAQGSLSIKFNPEL